MTKLLDKICATRDLLITKDISKIRAKLIPTHRLTDEIKRQVKKFGSDVEHYKLDFTSDDLFEMAEEVKAVITVCERYINPKTRLKKFQEHKTIDDKIFLEYTNTNADHIAVRAVMTEMHSLLCFFGIYINLLEKMYEQGEFNNVILGAIKDLM